MTLAAVLLASLFGSPHCAGMCGGFVALYASQNKNSMASHAMYSLGRLSTYLLFGVLAGIVGSSIDFAGGLIGIANSAALVAACILILSGTLSLLGQAPSLGILSKFFSPLVRSQLVRRADSALGSYLLGFSTTFLPCGWLYYFVAVAAGTGAVIPALMVMAVFWVGTLPIMLSLATITNVLSLKARQYVPKVTACLIIAAGAYSLSAHFMHSSHSSHANTESTTESAAPSHHHHHSGH